MHRVDQYHEKWWIKPYKSFFITQIIWVWERIFKIIVKIKLRLHRACLETLVESCSLWLWIFFDHSICQVLGKLFTINVKINLNIYISDPNYYARLINTLNESVNHLLKNLWSLKSILSLKKVIGRLIQEIGNYGRHTKHN